MKDDLEVNMMVTVKGHKTVFNGVILELSRKNVLVKTNGFDEDRCKIKVQRGCVKRLKS
jgi:hypothetical protein